MQGQRLLQPGAYALYHLRHVRALSHGVEGDDEFIAIDAPGNGWLHAKLGVVVLIVLYHWICARMLRALAANTDQHSHRWFRWFNEVPVLLLVVAVALVVVKPF